MISEPLPPSAEKTPPHYLLYDGACPMCQALVEHLQAWGLLDKVQTCPLQDYPPADPALWEQGRVEVILLEPDTGQLWGGVDAFVQLLRGSPKHQTLGWLLGLPPLRTLARWLYQTVAYNRRIISPISPQGIPCACDPPENRAIQRRFYALLTLIPLISLSVFSYGFSHSAAMTRAFPWLTLLQALYTAMLLGFVAANIALWLLLKAEVRRILPQTLLCLSIGSLYVLLAGLLANWLHAPAGGGQLGAFAISSLGFGLHTLGTAPRLQRRLKTIGAPSWSPWLWLSVYVATALETCWLALH